MYERRDFLCSGFAALIGDSLQLSGVSGRQDHICLRHQGARRNADR
jgi:hypothetical protein